MKKLLLFLLVTAPSANIFPSEIFSSREVVVWGIVQGATEYLPISSTGHLLFADKLLLTGGGEEVRCGATTDGILHAKNAYFMVIQFGSILAVLLLYRRRVGQLFVGLVNKRSAGRKLLRNLFFSFLPTAAVGFLIDGWLQRTLYTDAVVAMSLILGAGIMFWAERRYFAKNGKAKGDGDFQGLTVRQSLSIGLWQCLSLIPGMSRSMCTIVGGYGCNLRRSEAAEYSFLLGLVTLSAATVYKLAKDFNAIFAVFSFRTFATGIFVAFVASSIAIKFFITFISRHGLHIFAWYRLVLAGIILWMLP